MYIVVGMGLVPLKSNLAKSIMIGAAFGCTIGSLATPLGGARNPLTIGYLRLEGIHISFLRWMIISMPVVVFSLIAVWLILIFVFPSEIKNLKKGRMIIQSEVDDLPPFQGKNILVVGVLFLIVVGFIVLPTLWDVELSLIALIGAVVIFMVGGMNWKDVENKIPWGIILLYGGAISIGIHLANSGGAGWLADQVLDLTAGNVFLSIVLIILLSKLLTEFMSNTAAVSILLPIGFAVFTSVGLPPEMGSMLVALSGGLAFMFLISTPGNLISFSSGYFDQKDLIKVGIIANLVTIGIILIVAYTYWKWIGVW
jgi:sodium-dependent dicarboxylate transporter 2/3/5